MTETATTTAGRREITAPGIYPDLTAEEYHADPVPGGSLSSTGARRLLPPTGCPALFHHEQSSPPAPRNEWDIGTAAHKLVLGDGPDIVITGFDDWRTKASREARDAIRLDGAVPLLNHEGRKVQAMAAALRRHPVASALFDPANGVPEQSLFWADGPTGVVRRARLDWLPTLNPGRLIIRDYKTAVAVDPESIARAVEQHGYHQQAAWYLDGAQALGLAGRDAAFLLVFQQKTPPYLVTVVELDVIALRIGAARNRRAIETYARCKAEGRWPAFSDGIESIPLPAWAEKRDTEEYL